MEIVEYPFHKESRRWPRKRDHVRRRSAAADISGFQEFKFTKALRVEPRNRSIEVYLLIFYLFNTY